MATFNGTEGNDTLIGGTAADDLHGFGGNDFLQGGDGADTVLGDAGNDTMSGNAGNDWVRGGTGNDQVTGGGGQDSFAFADFGATNADVVTDFSGGWDNIQLDVSAFTALGATGRFASGDVRFFAGTAAHDADDRIIYNSATGELWYDADGNGAGAAQLIATLSNRASMSATDIFAFNSGGTPPPPSPTAINGTSGNDTLTGTDGADTINGLGGNDSIRGLGANDSLDGGSGMDTLDGGAGADTLVGGTDDDVYVVDTAGDTVVEFENGGEDLVQSSVTYTMPAWTNNLTLTGGAAIDATGNELDNIITGNAAHNALRGGAGNDSITGMGGEDFFFGGDGNDTLVGAAGHDFFVGDAGNDQAFGATGSDQFVAGAGDDFFSGGDDNDFLEIRAFQTPGIQGYGNDTFDGGAGRDEIFVEQISSVVVDLGAGTLTGGVPSGSAVFTSVEDFIVWYDRVYNDLITGSAANNMLSAGAGNDTVDGGGGDDTLRGQEGNDVQSGGAGADVFWIQEAPGSANADTILDFTSGTDVFWLDGHRHAGIGEGRFAADDARFYAAAGASGGHDADDRVVYDTSTGNLWYDQDGNGSGAAQLIATLQGAPLLRASDIQVDNPVRPFVFQGGPENNDVFGDVENDSLSGGGGDDTLRGNTGNDTLNGQDGNDSLIGGPGADSMVGGDGNDTLDGLNSPEHNSTDPDVDTMDGGTGNDTYYVDNTGDVLVDSAGIDTVITHNTPWTLGAGFENLIIDNDDEGGLAIGNELDNVLDAATHSAGRVRLEGRGGNDVLLSGSGSSTLLGGDGNDTITARSIDVVDGGNGDDVIISGPFGSGPTLTGGAGSDSFVFRILQANASRIVDFSTGIDKIHLDANGMPGLGVSGNFAPDDARFFAAAGATSGHDADDRVVYDTSTGDLYFDADGSGSAAAQLVARLNAGSDAASLTATDIVVDNGTTPSPTPSPSPTPTPTPIPAGSIVGTAGNDNMSGTAGNDTIFGLAGNDTIFANGGNDWVQGGAGNDQVSGGSGQDIYAFAEYGAANADTVANFGSGWDAIQLDAGGFSSIGASGRFAGGDVRFFAAAGATSAHDADDRIVYNTSNGQLFYDADGVGGAGAELIGTFTGAPGMAASDITVFGTATPSPTPSPTPTPSTINGTNGNDSLVGTASNDTINGFDGNDTIDGAGGADSMVGGNGDDLYFVNNPGDTVVEAQNGGIDEVRTQIGGYTLPDWVNNLTLVGGALSGTGNAIENMLIGNALNNTLSGGDGNDTLHGEAGDDTLSGGLGNDVLSEVTNNGHDTFVFNVAPGAANADRVFDFQSGQDRIQIDGTVFTNIGASGSFSASDPRFFAGSAAHDADDRIIYDGRTLWYDADGNGAGAQQEIATFEWDFPADPPTVPIAASDITVVNGQTTPTPTPTPAPGTSLSGTTGNDSLVGTSGNDTIYGNSGNDWLEGRLGNDQLSGGSGMDSYVFREFGAGNADQLLNFDGNNWDSLRFDNAAFTALGADGRFTAGDARFYAAAGATGGHDADDRIVYNTSTGQLYYDADGSGAGGAELVATIQGAAAVAAPDIWVI